MDSNIKTIRGRKVNENRIFNRTGKGSASILEGAGEEKMKKEIGLFAIYLLVSTLIIGLVGSISVGGYMGYFFYTPWVFALGFMIRGFFE